MLLFEDLALVPLLFLLRQPRRQPATSASLLDRRAGRRVLVIGVMLVAGRFLLPPLFAQAARTKSPELFLAVSLLTVILASLATSAVGLSPILGALIAGVLIAETDYRNEVEVVTAPLRGLALGVFLITVGMSIDLPDHCSATGRKCLRRLRWCYWSKWSSPACCCAWRGRGPGSRRKPAC